MGTLKQVFVLDKKRSETEKGGAQLKPTMNRPNLHVSTNSYVTKILTENRKAVGITFIRDNVEHVIKANKEVIISAVNSPQLLMLSGIGPKEHLSSIKVA
nr:oxygen-dependent choline dehydrogenase-like [Crassostrea gigas]